MKRNSYEIRPAIFHYSFSNSYSIIFTFLHIPWFLSRDKAVVFAHLIFRLHMFWKISWISFIYDRFLLLKPISTSYFLVYVICGIARSYTVHVVLRKWNISQLGLIGWHILPVGVRRQQSHFRCGDGVIWPPPKGRGLSGSPIAPMFNEIILRFLDFQTWVQNIRQRSMASYRSGCRLFFC